MDATSPCSRAPSASVTALVVTCGLAISSCGGGSGTVGGLSKAQLTTRANAICKQALSAISAIAQPSSPQTNPAGLATYLDRVVPIADRQLSQLTALRPAAGVASDWNDFVGKERAATLTLGQALGRARAHDLSGIQTLIQTATTEGTAANAAAKKVGATTCASG